MGFGRWVAIWKRRSAPGWCRLVVWTSVFASVWSGDVCWAQAAREKIEATDEWQSLYLGKTRVGYLRSASALETVDGRELIR